MNNREREKLFRSWVLVGILAIALVACAQAKPAESLRIEVTKWQECSVILGTTDFLDKTHEAKERSYSDEPLCPKPGNNEVVFGDPSMTYGYDYKILEGQYKGFKDDCYVQGANKELWYLIQNGKTTTDGRHPCFIYYH
ncbi:MAG: hypothetical protein UX87_C0001G0034 [Candidatus Amesbacteria bacterium GW2011_GWA1_47_16]|uniref:Uncharacterized protein n=5 Tax=Candidatus Amesiibacteriota TaxID=1752730 RepID=A0A1F4ZY01_9BACT|nr:MAG: hypothetical protein UX86_C0003G0023 [Candidatus Amesbacteria bacterium GW2011_GWC1_47_15]KKU65123.1 MAG: hypothetical protein UX87_C0001G0034 [Candidatus Amesbacteria bacterium GW2011_GWA1_47_16]KKU97751.1 MAG: hypothetical protein UY28_C0014G0009 [Candidatus Amesbacteria bacterium GW2011_GWB1_48_13]OGC99805.1 MAG: hypothetical protein A2701_03420 [Candidatus Amesbacteria bacterium RIFCSPHIGHO2_01_FULL_47_34]OGD01221.1 MAG: hypothetical protein A2972_01425 [Candidatus Amesbacteria bact